MLALGGLGSKKNPSSADINGVVACLILYCLSVRVSYQQNCFLIGSEIGGVRLRRKSESSSSSRSLSRSLTQRDISISLCDWMGYHFSLFVDSRRPLHASRFRLESRIHLRWHSPCELPLCRILHSELKGRSLEETDELFEMNIWAWQFDKTETTGVGRRIALLEQGNEQGEILKGEGTLPLSDADVERGMTVSMLFNGDLQEAD